MPKPRRKRGPAWADASDEELLDLRFCDLHVRIEGTPLESRLVQLHDELERCGARLRPHAWLSSEWFSPGGVPGIAVPFYLAHPRLARLEKKMILRVEGGTKSECMRLLRHEAGHAVSTAFRLHYKRSWRETFGPASQPYPTHYQPRPNSRDYVLHLDWWYAQAHPTEDFAETFAVWLRPGSRWRSRYRTWPALEKLEMVDTLMRGIAGKAPPVRSRERADPLHRLRSTLRSHYRRKQKRYSDDSPEFYDRDLRRIFDADGGGPETATAFLRRVRPEVRRMVAESTGEHPYTIDMILRDMIDRGRELKLRRNGSEQEVKTRLMLLVTVETMHHLHRGRERIAL